MLNPNAFKSFEDFQKARFQEGIRRGWIPTFANFPISKKVSETGKRIVSRILEKRQHE